MPSSWSTLATPRGPLCAAQWTPPSFAGARPKAVLVFHHGYGEHVQRYEQGTIDEIDEKSEIDEREKEGARAVFLF